MASAPLGTKNSPPDYFLNVPTLSGVKTCMGRVREGIGYPLSYYLSEADISLHPLTAKKAPTFRSEPGWQRMKDSLFCGKATAVARCPRHLAKSRLSNPFLSHRQNKTAHLLGGLFVLAADEGFEPSQTESESGVLPLHKSAKRKSYYTAKLPFVKTLFTKFRH